MRQSFAIAASALFLALAVPASALAWPADYTGRLQALALLQTLNGDLLSHDSATLTLERWCGDHGLADPAKIVARRQTDIDKPVSPEQRQILGVGPDEPVRYRRVQLACGAHVLSEADNWYVPSRLTPEMNRVLDSSDTPFGRAVRGLRFQRRTLSAEMLWQPLPKGWERQPVQVFAKDAPVAMPEHVLQHRAILTLPDGTPFSQVVETYTSQVLAFPPPSR